MRPEKHSFGKVLFVLIAVLAATTLGLFLGHTLQETGRQAASQLTAVDSLPLSEQKLENEDLYYYYSRLTEKEQEYYREILTGLTDMEESIRVNTRDQDLLWKLYSAVLNDHPELYWVEYSYTGTAVITHADLTPEYNCTIEEKKQKDEELKEAEAAAITAVSGEESDYERVKSVFEYVVNTVDYDDEAEDNQNIYSALVKRSSVCAGYSREVQYLLQTLGIETIFVTGTIRGRGAHAWNIVKLGEHYYHVDATFGDRVFTTGYTEDMPEDLHYDYSYLCCDDSVMRDRIVDEGLDVPACTETDLNYYRLQGIYFDAYDSMVQDNIIAGIQEGTHYWRCQFSNDDAYQSMMEDINKSWYAEAIRDYGRQTSGQITTWSLHDDQNLVISLWY